MPSRSSHSPWVTTGVTVAPAARGVADRLEIDMGGQILFARPIQQRSKAVPAHRLQRVARGTQFMAIIDNQGCSAAGDELAGDGATAATRAGEVSTISPSRSKTNPPAAN